MFLSGYNLLVDRFAEMQSFVRVADLGSFTRAARELGLTPAAVSKQVRALEERLGARLLNRTTRRVALTEMGAAYRERARALLAEVEAAEAAVTRLQEAPRGTLRLNAPLEFGRTHLAGPLADFAAAHPALQVHVDLTDRFVDLVEEGYDLAVRIAALTDSSLVARRLAPCRRVLCASPTYLAVHGAPRRPEELRGHEGIDYAHTLGREWPFRAARGRVTVSVPARLRTNNGELMRRLALAGLGVALLPTFTVADDLRAGRLVEVLPGQLDADTTISAVYPHRRLLEPKVRLLVDHLARSFGSEPPWDRGLPSAPQTRPPATARRPRPRA